MKDYGVVTVKKIWTKRRVVSTLLLIFIGLFGAIALLTYYGQHVGSFTISMSDKASKHSIYLSTDPSFASYGAAAWSLNKVVDPAGGNLEVEYETQRLLFIPVHNCNSNFSSGAFAELCKYARHRYDRAAWEC
jgi:hypothetical protein